MAESKNWAVIDLTKDDALVLDIDGVQFQVLQFAGSFALNEIPTAVCLVAVGRDARSQGAATAATIHNQGKKLTPWVSRAKVTLNPYGEYSPNVPWPDSAEVIFDGYYTGYSDTKMAGKAGVTIHLVHWLADLGFSSALSADMHPSNPLALTARATAKGEAATGASRKPYYLPEHIGYDAIATEVEKDLWGGIKKFLTLLCNKPLSEPGGPELCGVQASTNTRGLQALSRIEGPDLPKDKSPNYIPLALQTRGLSEVSYAVAAEINQQTIESFAGGTLWDALVGRILPMFNMALVPLVNSAVIIADTPALQTPYKTIDVNEYDSAGLSALFPQPLRGVGVYSSYGSFTRLGSGEPSGNAPILSAGGCFVSTDKADASGVTRFIPSPPWLSRITFEGLLAPATSGVAGGAPIRTATTPAGAPVDPVAAGQPKKPSDMNDAAQQLNSDYAHSFYAANMLRGRSGPISGKLRFDIAPGSNIRCRHDPELFLQGVDSLAEDIYAAVNRVTIMLNAETQQAGTTFSLTHNRTTTENKDPRFSVSAHPLFGESIFKGAPLVENWRFDNAVAPGA